MKYALFLSFFLLLLCSGQSYAQSNHVYEDSSILKDNTEENISTDEEIVTPIEEDTYHSNVSNAKNAPDTFLVNNRHAITADSAKKIQDEKALAYAKKLDSLLKEMKQKPQEKKIEPVQHDSPSSLALFFNSAAVQYVLWGLAALFVLFILFKLFFTGGFFAKETTKSNIKILEEEEEKTIDAGSLDALMANAVKQQNYRLATRYLYLQLLQRLDAAGAIELAADKTNSIYLSELTGKPYKQEVAALTLYYEYVWYGEFAIGAEVFERLQARYKALSF